MFERFTDRARRVVVFAQEESRRLCHDSIGTEHLLLGMLREGEGVAAQALDQLGINLDEMRVAVEAAIPEGVAQPRSKIPFTPRAKKVLELSLREALRLGHNYIGTEHLLLGLVRDGGGAAGQILAQHGADSAAVTAAVLEVLKGGGKFDMQKVEVESGARTVIVEGRETQNRWTPGAQAVVAIAGVLAGSEPVGTHHLLAALAGTPDTAARAVLTMGGFDITDIPDDWDVTGTLDEPPEDKAARQVEVDADEEVLQVRITDDALREALLAALREGRLDPRTLAERFGEAALSLGKEAASSATAPADENDPAGADDPDDEENPTGDDDPTRG